MSARHTRTTLTRRQTWHRRIAKIVTALSVVMIFFWLIGTLADPKQYPDPRVAEPKISKDTLPDGYFKPKIKGKTTTDKIKSWFAVGGEHTANALITDFAAVCKSLETDKDKVNWGQARTDAKLWVTDLKIAMDFPDIPSLAVNHEWESALEDYGHAAVDLANTQGTPSDKALDKIFDEIAFGNAHWSDFDRKSGYRVSADTTSIVPHT